MSDRGDHPTRDMHDETSYALDIASSVLAFRAKAFLLMRVEGTLDAVDGELTVSPEGKLSASGAAASNSIATGIRVRNWHLKHAHYLSAAEHPRIALAIHPVDVSGGPTTARLHARGQSVTLDLDVEPAVLDGDTLSVLASGSFDRRALGMLPPLAGASRLVEVSLKVTARRT